LSPGTPVKRAATKSFSGEVGWCNGGKVTTSDGVNGSSEEKVENGWESGVHDVFEEVLVRAWVSSAPSVLVLESNEKLVDKRVSES